MLALNQTTSYAVLALSCLARDEASWHRLREISGCIGVPPPYLAKVLHGLARSGIVETKRGYKGGYRLGRTARAIRLMDVVRAVESSRVEGRCMLGLAECSDERACPAHGFWKVRRSEIVAYLEEMTLVALLSFDDFRRDCCAITSAGRSANDHTAGKKERTERSRRA
jgi:Rrf2 family protein